MRKIWTRKDKDKRRLLSGSPLVYGDSSSVHRHAGSLSLLVPDLSETSHSNASTADDDYPRLIDFHDDHLTLANTTIGLIAESATTVAPERPQHLPNRSHLSHGKRLVLSLVRPDYDSKLIKSGWLNVIVNLHAAPEISENTLKLARVELKGSHLYVYKGAVNARSFRLESSSPPPPPALEPVPDQRRSSVPSVIPETLPLTPSQPTILLPPLPPTVDLVITHFSTACPHPDLLLDPLGTDFAAGSSIEAMVHALLFDYDPDHTKAIILLTSVLPLLPRFGKVLRLVLQYLVGLWLRKIEGPYDFAAITSRLIALFKNIHTNFSGFLLISNVAPYILRILETLTEHLPDDHSVPADLHEIIEEFKNVMLAKQQSLINLVTNDQLSDATNPLVDLNASVFMNDINLIDLAATISAIDLKFFAKWNSNIDKSLLLYSSLNESSSSDFFYKKNPLIFNNEDHIHYLSRLLINHLLIEDSSNSSSSTSSSALEKRARLLEKWIDLGCLLDKSGNMSSWLGISSIILSQPILRLTKIWSLVSPDYIKLLKNDWSPVLFELDRRHLANATDNLSSDKNIPDVSVSLAEPSQKEKKLTSKDSYHIMAPRGLGKIYPKEKAIPYFGDLVINNYGASFVNPINIEDLEAVWKRIKYSFNRWNEYLSNLTNHNNIIKYNDDVLRRYDNMGFIFSNESLNQVLYLGMNDDNSKPSLPPSDPAEGLDASSTLKRTINVELQDRLLRLIEVNCDSINLEKIMKLSLQFEPDLLESYLKLPLTDLSTLSPATLTFRHNNNSSSNFSIHSNDSSSSVNTTAPDTTTASSNVNGNTSYGASYGASNQSSNNNLQSPSIGLPHVATHLGGSTSNYSTNTSQNVANEFNPASRIPIFNNHYFKINLAKYDELTISANGRGSAVSTPNYDPKVQYHTSGPVSEKHNVVVDHDLTFRIDDFVADIDSSMINATTLNAFDDVDNVDIEDDVPGLGIDVDDILNSEKFNNFTISSSNSPKVESTPTINAQTEDTTVTDPIANEGDRIKAHHGSFGVSSTQSTANRASGTSSNINSHQNHRYIPKYASVDKLVDLLLLDSKYFDEYISLDLTEYRFVFLLNYNSFITTKELLEKLAYRFVNSGNAVISLMKRQYLIRNELDSHTSGVIDFPNWNIDTTVDLVELGEVDYELLLKIQINILKVLIVLLNNFYSNFATDLTNKRILIKLLKLFSNEILQWYNSNKIDSNLEKSFESLVNYYKKLKKLFVKKTYRPIEVLKFDEYLINEFKFNNSLHEVPINRNLPGHKNINKIEKFLHKFNKLLAVFYKGIKAEDWLKVYKILEFQFENNSLFEFALQKNSINDDNLIISNIFNFFETLVDPSEKSLILKKFPLVFRKLFKIYFKFRSYLLIQLTDLNITVEERLDRMQTLLIMTKISKLKMSENQFVFEGDRETIPSCIETAIINVIYSPESRMFTNLWIKASNGLNTPIGSPSTSGPQAASTFDDLNLLLPVNIEFSDLVMNHEPLLPCFGWIIENLLETSKCPSFYRSFINFNKRYLIYRLIKELTVEDIDGHDDINYHDTKEFEFLLKLDENLASSQSLREFTFLEKDKAKLFKTVLKDQHKILVMDNKKKQAIDAKDHVVNSTATTATGANTSSQPLNKKASNSSLRRQSLTYKSPSSSRFKISGLFNKSRPFSLSVSGISQPERIVNAKELPPAEHFADPKQKPIAIISLKNKKIFPVYLLPLCFKIDSETSNDDFFFQAPKESELNDWLVKLNYANRHWFYSRSINQKGNHAFTSFGVPITVICNRDLSPCPRFLELIFEEIENEGLKEVGVYRISSSISELNLIKSTIDKNGTVNFNEKVYDVHTLTSCVKSFFRELPDALLTDKVIDSFFALKQQGQNAQVDDKHEMKQMDTYKNILSLLPSVNYYTLKTLLRHLQKISQFSDNNKMTASNLATVIGPALTEASSLDSLINNFGFMNSILEKLIVNFEYVFDEPAVENQILPDEITNVEKYDIAEVSV